MKTIVRSGTSFQGDRNALREAWIEAYARRGILEIFGYTPELLRKVAPWPIEGLDNNQVLVLPPRGEKEFRELGSKAGVTVRHFVGSRWRDPDQREKIEPYWFQPRLIPSEELCDRKGIPVHPREAPLCAMEAPFLRIAEAMGILGLKPDTELIYFPALRKYKRRAGGYGGKVPAMRLFRKVAGHPHELAMRNISVNPRTVGAFGTFEHQRWRRLSTPNGKVFGQVSD